jgi:RNA polymerase sigma-70 factor, ECF subfamily
VTNRTGVANNLEQAYELTLVLRSQLRDETAFEELLRQYSPRVRFYVSKMLGERHEQADDLVQDIWLNVYRGLHRLIDAGAFRAWLFRIARDRVSREFRRARIDVHSFSEMALDEVAFETDDTSIDTEAVRQQIGSLSHEHREALVLRFIEDMSYEEIARVTGSTLGTVRSRIHYAKRALRRAFEEKSYERK